MEASKIQKKLEENPKEQSSRLNPQELQDLVHIEQDLKKIEKAAVEPDVVEKAYAEASINAFTTTKIVLSDAGIIDAVKGLAQKFTPEKPLGLSMLNVEKLVGALNPEAYGKIFVRLIVAYQHNLVKGGFKSADDFEKQAISALGDASSYVVGAIANELIGKPGGAKMGNIRERHLDFMGSMYNKLWHIGGSVLSPLKKLARPFVKLTDIGAGWVGSKTATVGVTFALTALIGIASPASWLCFAAACLAGTIASAAAKDATKKFLFSRVKSYYEDIILNDPKIAEEFKIHGDNDPKALEIMQKLLEDKIKKEGMDDVLYEEQIKTLCEEIRKNAQSEIQHKVENYLHDIESLVHRYGEDNGEQHDENLMAGLEHISLTRNMSYIRDWIKDMIKNEIKQDNLTGVVTETQIEELCEKIIDNNRKMIGEKIIIDGTPGKIENYLKRVENDVINDLVYNNKIEHVNDDASMNKLVEEAISAQLLRDSYYDKFIGKDRITSLRDEIVKEMKGVDMTKKVTEKVTEEITDNEDTAAETSDDEVSNKNQKRL
ncbi:MAG: hypothetical protein WCH10_05100 [bacterium]